MTRNGTGAVDVSTVVVLLLKFVVAALKLFAYSLASFGHVIKITYIVIKRHIKLLNTIKIN